MIAQSNRSSSFKALTRYLETPKAHRQERTRIAWTDTRNLVCTGSLEDIAWEMTVVARGNERVRKPAYHISVSWAPEDKPTRGQMTEVADELMGTLALSDHQALYVAHADEQYEHVHVVTNLVHPVRRRVQNPGLCYRRMQKVLRHAERRFGFREVPGHYYQLPGQEPPDRSQSLSKGAAKALDQGRGTPFQLRVKSMAEQDFTESHSWQELNRRLDGHGLRLMPRRSGLVVTDGQEFAKCSSAAPNTSLRLLEARFQEPFTPELAPVQEQSPSLKSLGYEWDDGSWGNRERKGPGRNDDGWGDWGLSKGNDLGL